jgi:hypothetical protein
MDYDVSKPERFVHVNPMVQRGKGKGYGSTIIRSNTNALNLGEESDFEDIVKHLESELNRSKGHSLNDEQDPLDEWVFFIGGYQISLWDVWNGFVKILVAVALGLLLGFAVIRYRKHELFASIFPEKTDPSSSTVVSIPTTVVTPPVKSTIPSYLGAAPPLNDGLTATVDNMNEKYIKSLSLPPNSLFLQPYRLSTITIGGVNPGCSLYWSLASVDDTSLRAHGTVEEDRPPEFEVTPRVSGEYLLTVEENCSHDSSFMRSLNMPVYVQDARRGLRTG